MVFFDSLLWGVISDFVLYMAIVWPLLAFSVKFFEKNTRFFEWKYAGLPAIAISTILMIGWIFLILMILTFWWILHITSDIKLNGNTTYKKARTILCRAILVLYISLFVIYWFFPLDYPFSIFTLHIDTFYRPLIGDDMYKALFFTKSNYLFLSFAIFFIYSGSLGIILLFGQILISILSFIFKP